MINVSELSFVYPGGQALTNVTLTVRRGRVTALVGPNGAGKTTLMRCMAALSRPYCGRIMMDGADIVKHPDRGRRMTGYLPDFFGLYDHLTVAECLDFFARAHFLSPREIPQRITAVAEDVDLADRMNIRAGSLSRGQRQRLALAQALIHDPPVLLLDEPASGLDPEARIRLSGLLTRLSASGRTLLVSSHILAELDQYATDLIVLQNGRVVENRHLSETTTGTVRRVRIRLLDRSSDSGNILAELASKRPEIRSVEPDGKDWVIALSTTGTEAEPDADPDATLAALLKILIQNGLDLTHFASQQDSMERRYLDTLAAGEPDSLRMKGGRS